MAEKRRYARFKTPFCVQCDWQNRFQSISGVTRDVSMKGASFLLDTEVSIPPESILSFYFLLPQSTLKIRGEVVWAKDIGNKKGLGVSFKYIADHQKQEIYDNIIKYFPEEIIQRWWQV